MNHPLLSDPSQEQGHPIHSSVRYLAYLWVIPIGFVWPLIHALVFVARSGRLPSEFNFLVFLPMGLISGAVLVFWVQRAKTRTRRATTLVGYLLSGPFAFIGSLLSGLVFPPPWGVILYGVPPLVVGATLGYAVGTLSGLRWTARIWSLVIIGLLVRFFAEEALTSSQALTPREWIMLFFFPVGVIVGMILGWRQEGWGGAIVIESLITFWVISPSGGWLFNTRSTWELFLHSAAPAFLFLAYSILSHRAQNQSHSSRVGVRSTMKGS